MAAGCFGQGFRIHEHMASAVQPGVKDAFNFRSSVTAA